LELFVMEEFFGALLGILFLIWLVGMGLFAAGSVLVLSLAVTFGAAFLFTVFLLVQTCRAFLDRLVTRRELAAKVERRQLGSGIASMAGLLPGGGKS
jgi:membrane protein implicated in regulation of membrane protease activity